jgi:hypothetical protein
MIDVDLDGNVLGIELLGVPHPPVDGYAPVRDLQLARLLKKEPR